LAGKTIHPVVKYGRRVGDRNVLLLRLKLKVLSSDLCGNSFIENSCTLDKKFIPHGLNAVRRFWHNDLLQQRGKLFGDRVDEHVCMLRIKELDANGE